MAPHQRLQALEGHMRGVSIACLLLARARHLVWWSLSFCKEEERKKDRERLERETDGPCLLTLYSLRTWLQSWNKRSLKASKTQKYRMLWYTRPTKMASSNVQGDVHRIFASLLTPTLTKHQSLKKKNRHIHLPPRHRLPPLRQQARRLLAHPAQRPFHARIRLQAPHRHRRPQSR